LVTARTIVLNYGKPLRFLCERLRECSRGWMVGVEKGDHVAKRDNLLP